MSSIDITEVIVEIAVAEEMEDSIITSFRHRRTNKELNFEMVGRWLVDMEDEVEFPKEIGKYTMNADWHDNKEIILGIYDIVKIS